MVAHGSEIAHRGAATISELLQIGFAKDNSACLLQTAHHFGIFRRNAVLEQLARGRRSHARRIDVVLHGDGDAVQRPDLLAATELLVALAGSGERLLVHHRDEGSQDWIEFRDPIQTRLRELDRGDGAAGQQVGRLTQCQARQVTLM